MRQVLAVIDTNVIVSALLTRHEDAATLQVLNETLCGRITPVVSDQIIGEYEEVLSRKKFPFSAEDIALVVSGISKRARYLQPLHSEESQSLPDKKDVVFYEVALAGNQDGEETFLVTGNTKHFPAKPIVVTPAEMIGILDAE